MLRFITPRRFVNALVMLGVVLALLPPWAVAKVSNPLWMAMSLLLAPLSAPANRLSNAIRTPPTDSRYQRNYQRLLEEFELQALSIRQLEEDLRAAQDDLAKLSQLQIYRQTQGLEGIKMQPAGVTLRSRAGVDTTLTINAGKSDQIEPGMLVVSGYQLVGRIASVGAMTSTVQLITAPGTHIGVRIVPPTTGAATREMLGAAESTSAGRELLVEAPRGAAVQVGDLAHVFNDERYKNARGFVVGRVAQVSDHPRDPTLRSLLVIKPDISLPNLDRVMILIPVKPTAPVAPPVPVPKRR